MRLQRRPNEPNTRSQTRSKFREWRPTLMAVWACHFAVSIAVISLASMKYDDDRKYIPIDAKTIEGDCPKAYLNVYATSTTDDGAIICCRIESTEGICQALPFYLSFARRLSKFPEAWLVPVFPLLIRWLVQFTQRSGPTTTTYILRRFYLYFGLIQSRGWILYLLFDKIEDLIVPPAADACWYDGNLRSYQTPCKGQVFDYSDHTVLFFAQILPIALTEVLFSFVVPYSKNKSFLVPTIMSVIMAFLYLITFLETTKTVAYFHTISEIGVGYLISLLIQVPLFLITSTSVMETIRDFFFGEDSY